MQQHYEPINKIVPVITMREVTQQRVATETAPKIP